jgi:4-hydroxy-tetrahydrodipicolinate reductase
MLIIVIGTGKLARELLNALPSLCSAKVVSWANADNAKGGDTVVIHAGSGRELEDVISYCHETGSALVELATGSEISSHDIDFPAVVCPNTNILMLKFMAMLASSGRYFKGCKLKIIESHQAGKTSVPGTAVNIAQSLDFPSEKIISIRDPREQQELLKIELEHLARHAYHRIEIGDGGCSIALETRVCDSAPYAEGVATIISAVISNNLEHRKYNIMEFVENGWV